MIPLLALLVSCGGGSTPTGLPPVNVVGSYLITHDFVILGLSVIACQGTLTIDTQNEGSFSGTVTLDAVAPCEGFGGVTGTVSGTVDGSDVAFQVVGIEDLLSALNCTVTGGDQRFSGQATIQSISASRTINGRCTLQGNTQNVQVRWVIEGSRS